MAGELRMADHLRHRARTPALVGRHVFGRGADREGRNQIEAERVGVIVVDQEDDIRLLLLQPLLGEVIAIEDRLPIRLRGLAKVECCTNRRHMRCVDAG
jgi:hypothetical protein